MSEKKIVDLYELLPALYRLEDAEQDYKLGSFLDIISDQVEVIKRDIDGLWDDFFIETCADWVVPYIGDLVANNPMHEVAQRRRVDVAKTIYYRRRKGTLPMLEELARDVTGWGAHAVAFFELLSWTQNLNHLRYQMAPNPGSFNPNVVTRVGSVNLRNVDALDRLDGPFDKTSHTVDVRSIDQIEGWYNIRKVGFFLWRLGSYPWGMVVDADEAENVSDDLVQARKSTVDYGYYFNPLGGSLPLFNNPNCETEKMGPETEIHLPGFIRPLALALDLERCRQAAETGKEPKSDYYGKNLSFYIKKDEDEIQPESIICMDLSDNWVQPPNEITYKDKRGNNKSIYIDAAVDVRSGRIAFAENKTPKEGVKVSFHYGFSADLGGGPYERRDTLTNSELAELEITVSKYGLIEDSVPTIQQALDNWKNGGKLNCIITIADNATYEEAISIELTEGKWLAIQAANQKRPSLILAGSGILEAEGQPGAGLVLNGLLIKGAISADERVEELSIVHSTLVLGRGLDEEGLPREPDKPSVTADDNNNRLHLKIDHSIVGALHLPAGMAALSVSDSIIDGCEDDHLAIGSTDGGDKTGPPTMLERTTVFGMVNVKELVFVSNVIFKDLVSVARHQAGCVRFSYVPEGSQTPRRYRCQPDMAIDQRAKGLDLESANDLPQIEKNMILERIKPKFTSIHCGDPAYAQLSLNCAEEIRSGAENRSEMGVFSSLKQPQRESNLRIRLEEYLPFGLEAGFVYVT